MYKKFMQQGGFFLSSPRLLPLPLLLYRQIQSGGKGSVKKRVLKNEFV